MTVRSFFDKPATYIFKAPPDTGETRDSLQDARKAYMLEFNAKYDHWVEATHIYLLPGSWTNICRLYPHSDTATQDPTSLCGLSVFILPGRSDETGVWLANGHVDDLDKLRPPVQSPLPDIKRDRIMCIIGASFKPQSNVLQLPLRSPRASVTLIPISHCGPLEAWPWDGYMEVGHEVLVGTVDEIAEDFKAKMTRAFECLTCKQPDGSHAVIPLYGEASMRRNTEILERHGFNRFTKVDTEKWREAILAEAKRREALRNHRLSASGIPPRRQDVLLRDVLMTLVGAYAASKSGNSVGMPGDDPDVIDKLIDDLTILRDDKLAEARQGGYWNAYSARSAEGSPGSDQATPGSDAGAAEDYTSGAAG